MEDEDMSFDAPAAASAEPVRRKLSRLKRAVHASAPTFAAQQQLPAVSDTFPRALVDRTNTNTIREQASSRRPELSPARVFLAANNAASSPNQPSAHLDAASSSPEKASAESQDSEQPAQMEAVDTHAVYLPKSPPDNDYWDSEDELEAELTRRERAEGFHADSATSSGWAEGTYCMSECCTLMFRLL